MDHYFFLTLPMSENIYFTFASYSARFESPATLVVLVTALHCYNNLFLLSRTGVCEICNGQVMRCSHFLLFFTGNVSQSKIKFMKSLTHSEQRCIIYNPSRMHSLFTSKKYNYRSHIDQCIAELPLLGDFFQYWGINALSTGPLRGHQWSSIGPLLGWILGHCWVEYWPTNGSSTGPKLSSRIWPSTGPE